jgi:hypothetical protein
MGGPHVSVTEVLEDEAKVRRASAHIVVADAFFFFFDWVERGVSRKI